MDPGKWVDTPTSSLSPDEITQQENAIRAKPPFAAAKIEYEGAMTEMANHIVALVPGLRWHFEDNSWSGCPTDYPGIDTQQVYQMIGFSGPIPDDKWSHALQIVKDGAARFGATHFGAFHDAPGNHDIYLAGPDGIEFRLGTQAAASLTAKSDCRIVAEK